MAKSEHNTFENTSGSICVAINAITSWGKFSTIGRSSCVSNTVKDLRISSFAFRLSGSDALLHEAKENQMKKDIEEINQKFEKTESELNKIYADKEKTSDKEEQKKSTLPPELYEKLENIKRSMLTNSSK